MVALTLLAVAFCFSRFVRLMRGLRVAALLGFLYGGVAAFCYLYPHGDVRVITDSLPGVAVLALLAFEPGQ